MLAALYCLAPRVDLASHRNQFMSLKRLRYDAGNLLQADGWQADFA